jgi:glucose/arabinose dehydrogenase
MSRRAIVPALTVIASVSLGCEAMPARPETASEIVSSTASVRPPISLEEVASGLDSPVYVTVAPGEPGRLYVVERAGTVRTIENGEVDPQPFLDLRRDVRTQVEEGMSSIAFHPGYESNGLLFVYFNDRSGDIRVRAYRARGGAVLEGGEHDVVWIDKPDVVKWHNGGQLQFGPDGALYFGTGDAARNPYDGQPNPPSTVDPMNSAQNLALPFGKLFRLDVPDRPWSPAGLRPVAGLEAIRVDGAVSLDMVAYGLRNPWRFSFDRLTGDLYLGDVGQFRWEEIDAVQLGDRVLNFGWSAYEGLEPFVRRRLNDRGRLVEPIYVYEHGTGPLYCPRIGSIVGGYVYRGSVPSLSRRYVFGDYCSGELFALARGGDPDAAASLLPDRVSDLVSFGEDEAGELYAVSLSGGTVYRIAEAA